MKQALEILNLSIVTSLNSGNWPMYLKSGDFPVNDDWREWAWFVYATEETEPVLNEWGDW
jgi:hypothetical protein